MSAVISTENDLYRRYRTVENVPIAYVDVGEGDPILFLHGNPTPSYIWRHIIPYALPFGRCLAPDYPGMGNSGPAPDGRYRFFDQRRYLDAWLDAMDLHQNIILVLHDCDYDSFRQDHCKERRAAGTCTTLSYTNG